MWLENDSASMPIASTSMSTLPNVCTASTWNGTPASRAIAPMARTGCTVPTSLLACMIEIAIVSGRSARRTASGSTIPYWSTGR